ncbi:MAG: hypothetical protein Ta2A_20260 [Treponemataceae bacterium]|nr:MAG: hypothetical protein Ta2A_20260 [Treponemataceae bacterium]
MENSVIMQNSVRSTSVRLTSVKSTVKSKWMLFALFALFAVLGASCSSMPKVTRLNADKQVDVSGLWNDTDVRKVCKGLIEDFLASPRAKEAIAAKRTTPTVLVGYIKNDSMEHIDTSIISNRMEVVIFNSGKLDFVAGGNTRDQLRSERQSQQTYASEATAKKAAQEIGADFMLTGSIKTIVDEAGGKMVRTYYVTAEITDVETNRRIWMGENSEIKKLIKRPRASL